MPLPTTRKIKGPETASTGARPQEEGAKLHSNPPLLIVLSSRMALTNVGSIVLNLLIFITTLVNFTYALTALEPLVLLVLYAVSKIFVRQPEEGMFAKCQHRNLYQDG
jgi:hypothetical protein